MNSTDIFESSHLVVVPKVYDALSKVIEIQVQNDSQSKILETQHSNELDELLIISNKIDFEDTEPTLKISNFEFEEVLSQSASNRDSVVNDISEMVISSNVERSVESHESTDENISDVKSEEVESLEIISEIGTAVEKSDIQDFPEFECQIKNDSESNEIEEDVKKSIESDSIFNNVSEIYQVTVKSIEEIQNLKSLIEITPFAIPDSTIIENDSVESEAVIYQEPLEKSIEIGSIEIEKAKLFLVTPAPENHKEVVPVSSEFENDIEINQENSIEITLTKNETMFLEERTQANPSDNDSFTVLNSIHTDDEISSKLTQMTDLSVNSEPIDLKEETSVNNIEIQKIFCKNEGDRSIIDQHVDGSVEDQNTVLEIIEEKSNMTLSDNQSIGDVEPLSTEELIVEIAQVQSSEINESQHSVLNVAIQNLNDVILEIVQKEVAEQSSFDYAPLNNDIHMDDFMLKEIDEHKNDVTKTQCMIVDNDNSNFVSQENLKENFKINQINATKIEINSTNEKSMSELFTESSIPIVQEIQEENHKEIVEDIAE
ncbi:hypothetical protein HK096_008755, partial [Nowakowskiella sp. JEL0078]